MHMNGPLMIDLCGEVLTTEEQEMIAHPLVSGVILFTRNYTSREQISHLIHDIRSAKKNQYVLIAVDHEGGRVQRFRAGFTQLPSARQISLSDGIKDQDVMTNTKKMGWLMAAELLAVGVDFSFAPVLDLDYGRSDIIGDRAFHHEALMVTQLAGAYIDGMHEAGMASVAKHFPGHGAIKEDSHLALPVDDRPLADLMEYDIKPFQLLIREQRVNAVMPAHVIYSQVDRQPAGFSRVWIQDILRQQLSFNGVVFSDDLNMAAAKVAGSVPERAYAALSAGCDMALICNNRPGAMATLDQLQWQMASASIERLTRMKGQFNKIPADLFNDSDWKATSSLAITVRNFI